MGSLLRWLLVVVLLGTGIWLSAGGIWLLSLGGSAYYVVTGLACLVCGVGLIRRRAVALWVYAALLVGTAVWAVAEVQFDFWQLLPRLGGPLVIGVLLTTPWIWRQLAGAGRHAALAQGLTTLVVAILLVGSFATNGLDAAATYPRGEVAKATGAVDWPAYGRTISGTRFTPATQITPQNVGKLKRAWVFNTQDGPRPRPDGSTALYNFQVTPLNIGDVLYLTSTRNIITALDATTGKALWRFDPRIDETNVLTMSARGVSYHRSSTPTAECPERLLFGTLDGRLIALDARTGKPCAGFGQGGTVPLHEGMGKVAPGTHYTTSPPLVMGDVLVINGYVLDNQTTGEPSGVVRAYDVHDGHLLWAWDAGRPDGAGPLKPGEIYTRGSVNSWSIISGDPKLGLVYLPTGNATPDYIGTFRTAQDDKYGSSVVALDVKTGQVRWHFQTTHHDIWDFDIPSQPVLVDIPVKGRVVPALAQATKRGDLYLLDRRTGQPIAPVVERPVPRGEVAGERYAPTQPYSVALPWLRPPILTEKAMWGATPLDQLWCRITFRKYDYQGDFTPPSTRGAISSPANWGSTNWGGVSIDESRSILVANSSGLPMIVRLVGRKEADAAHSGESHKGIMAQRGTPYGAALTLLMSPIGLPCVAPPWGRLTAIDLKTFKPLWQRRLGDTRDRAPLGMGVPGSFNQGGSITTATGLTFIGATMDRSLRAFDTRTGKELWRGDLPAGGNATPMTFVSPRDGKQYVVIAAGGSTLLGVTMGDSLVAFRLED